MSFVGDILVVGMSFVLVVVGCKRITTRLIHLHYTVMTIVVVHWDAIRF